MPLTFGREAHLIDTNVTYYILKALTLIMPTCDIESINTDYANVILKTLTLIMPTCDVAGINNNKSQHVILTALTIDHANL